jgi:hypothetical protein
MSGAMSETVVMESRRAVYLCPIMVDTVTLS